MTEPVIKPEPFPKSFCMVDIIVVWIDLNNVTFIDNYFCFSV